MDKQGKFEKMAEMMKSFCTGEGSMADCCSMMMKKMMQCCEEEKPEKKKETGEETSTKQT
jgi:hypothetical protein